MFIGIKRLGKNLYLIKAVTGKAFTGKNYSFRVTRPSITTGVSMQMNDRKQGTQIKCLIMKIHIWNSLLLEVKNMSTIFVWRDSYVSWNNTNVTIS